MTSGGFGPSVGGPVAMGYVDRRHAAEGTELALLVRGLANHSGKEALQEGLVIGDERERAGTRAGLRSATPHLRGAIGKQVRLKFLPELEFEEDASIEQAERIDVALRVGGQAYAEIDVRLGEIDGSARADRADDIPLADERALPDVDRPEMHERRGVSERRLDRNGLAAGRHRPGE